MRCSLWFLYTAITYLSPISISDNWRLLNSVNVTGCRNKYLFVFMTKNSHNDFIHRDNQYLFKTVTCDFSNTNNRLHKVEDPRLKYYLEFGRTKLYKRWFTYSFQRLLICTARILIRRLDSMSYLYDRHSAIESWNIQRVLCQSHKFITTFMDLLVKIKNTSCRN